VYIGFCWGNLRERDNFAALIVGGRIICRWIIRKWDGVMDWIPLTQDRDWWRALVNAIMNLYVP